MHKYLYFLLSLIFITSVLFVAPASAQNIEGIDFENLRAQEVSDQQLRRLMQRMQEENMTINEVERMALARGMAPSEVSRLKNRLQELNLQQQSDQTKKQARPGDRKVSFYSDTTDSLVAPRPDSVTVLEKKLFGYKLFSNKQLSFEPKLNIPTPEDYELASGDELLIDIWGAAENYYQLTIGPEGTIQFGNLAPVYLSGLTIDQARDRIKEQLSKIYAGLDPQDGDNQSVFSRVSLGTVRSISVSIVGEVRQSGTYTVPSLATVYNALYQSGGPSKNGSFRKIKLIRNNEVHTTLDLYDFLVKGIQTNNVRLNDGDIIKISPYENRVEIKGKVKHPGIFETVEGETISDLMEYAGGFTESAYKEMVTIRRNTDKERMIQNVKQNEYDDFTLRNGDVIRVNPILNRFTNRIQIKGAVYRPGEFELRDTTTVHSLIKRADGLRDDAFTNRALIYRTQPDLSTKTISLNLSKIMNNPDDNDIPLEREDVVQVYSKFDLKEQYSVSINGAVQSSGTYPFSEDLTLEDLILQANGFKEEAAPYRIEVARRIVEQGDQTGKVAQTAEIYRFSVDEGLKLSPEDASFELKPYDKVFVFNNPNYHEQKTVTIAGEVEYPGTYAIENKSERISDLIERAGGLTPESYPEGATLIRERTESEKSTRQSTELLQQTDTLTQSMQTEEQESSMASRKIGITLPAIMENPDSDQDLLLFEGDSLFVPKKLQTVEVRGEVLYPVRVRYEDGRSLQKYVSSAGGYTEEARRKRAYVIYANGEVDRTKSFLWIKNYPDVEPGATIVVPQKEEGPKLSPQERVSILSAVVSTLSLVTTTVIQITRN